MTFPPVVVPTLAHFRSCMHKPLFICTWHILEDARIMVPDTRHLVCWRSRHSDFRYCWPHNTSESIDKGACSLTGSSPSIMPAQCWPLYLTLPPEGFAKAKGQSGQTVPPVANFSTWKMESNSRLLFFNNRHLARLDMPFAHETSLFLLEVLSYLVLLWQSLES